MLSRRLPVAVMLIALGSCATPAPPSPPVAVVRAPPPRAAPAPIPVSNDWRDWPVTPGDWSYASTATGSIARFGRAGATALLTLTCDRASRQVRLARLSEPQATAPDLTIRTSTQLRAMPGRSSEDGYVVAALPTGDTLLDAMGFSRGRFVVQQAGAATLVVPAWAEVLRVTEDCRG